MMKKTVSRQCVAALAFGALILSTSWASAEMRQWTSSDGRKLQAEFVGTSGAGSTASVKLKLPDGKEVLYPVANLSEADRVFVQSNLPKDPAALAAAIDALVVKKAKESYRGLQGELAALPGNQDLNNDEKRKRKEEIEREMAMAIPNERTNDNQFVRRVYLDIAGRIPTYQEAEAFLNSSSRNKRAELIDKLLDSEAFGMRMYNYFADLFRIREGIFMMGNGDLKADPYIEYVKNSMKEDKPYDVMVKELLTATGKVWDTPASGYLLADSGMRLCNLSNTFTVFMGTEITCAQCHDHPFEEVYQMDFFKMASFMGGTETRARGGNMMMMGSSNYREEVARMNKVLKDAGKLRENENQDRNLGQWIGTNSIQVVDTGKNAVKLPHDYKYDDGEPNMTVDPGAYFGNVVDLEKYETPRQAFADWLASPENPRFTINTVNRLWKIAFGVAQIEPVYNIPGHLDGQAQNYELLTFLESMMKDLDYSVKDFFRVVYNTQTYQREAETMTPSLTQMDKGTYHFPGPILRRMSAEQLWDSLVTLTTPDPEAVMRRGADAYRNVMNEDLAGLKTAAQIEGWKERWRKAGGSLYSDEGGMVGRDDNVGGEKMFRASELRQPERADHFLRMFGQSDRQLIENQFTVGSSPQVMALLNGKITNAVLTSPDAYLIKEIAFGEGSKRDKVDKVFLSVLGRYPTSDEKSKAQSGMRAKRDRDASDKSKEAAEIAAIGDVIWALVNTREFMFIQ